MKHFIFTFLLLAHSLLFAQDGKITGRVLDSKGLLVEAATVIVLLGETAVNGAITDDQGVFSIQPVEPGTYNVRVEYLDWKKEITGVTVLSGSTIDLGEIQFQNQENGANLKEQVITEFKNPPMTKSCEYGIELNTKEIKNCGTHDVKQIQQITPNVNEVKNIKKR